MNTYIEKLQQAECWNQMGHLTLDDMKTVRLMNRLDTKFVTHRCGLEAILEEAMKQGYQVHFSAGALHGYDSTYYDTPDWEMYRMHHNRKLHRYKIRCRTYTDTAVSFLEIKEKSNKGRTRKERRKVPSQEPETLQSDDTLRNFIARYSGYDFMTLVPTLQTLFHRITLVNGGKTERITIDVGVHFCNLRNGQTAALDDLVILELKQDGRYHSTMRDILEGMRVKPFRVSKYCIGIALTEPAVKKNRFKRKLHFMEKIKHSL